MGRILRPHGIRGEVRMEVLTAYPERLPSHRVLYIGPDHAPYPVEHVRFHQGVALLKFANCNDRTTAETLRGYFVHVPLEEAVPLEEGEYYLFQVIGVEVFSEGGELLGQVVDVLESPAHDIYVVRGTRGEFLVPAVEEFVRELDLVARRMVVAVMPGLLE
ncbi:MAG: ribosome maturation factor RimM [Anaerolineae bacterium]|nr:ribosome maturation factor RimM [Anaerolineae bacterium]MDW7992229.1 ribosome maturation factor RimM [Anaerolineae bacterium]